MMVKEASKGTQPWFKRAVVIGALMLGVLGTSCGAYREGTRSDELKAEAVAEQLVYVRVVNYRSSEVTLTAHWAEGQQKLGTVPAAGDQTFEVEVGDFARMQMEIELVGGYRCITFAVDAYPGALLTLILYDGAVNPDFCSPIQEVSSIEYQA